MHTRVTIPETFFQHVRKISHLGRKLGKMHVILWKILGNFFKPKYFAKISKNLATRVNRSRVWFALSLCCDNFCGQSTLQEFPRICARNNRGKWAGLTC